MNVVCSQCNSTFKIADSKLPPKRSVAKCKKCGGRIVIEPGAAARNVTSVQPPGSRTAESKALPSTGPAETAAIVGEIPELAAYSNRRFAFAEILAPDKSGGYATRRNRLKLKMLAAVKDVLEQILEEGESVQRVAAGTAYFPAEIFFGNGWLTMLYNRYVIAATDRRLVMINTNHRTTRPSHYVFQTTYSGIKKVSRGLLGTSIVLSRKNGKRRIFSSVRRFLSAEMQKFILGMIDPSAQPDPSVDSLEKMCPGCFTPLTEKLASCPACRSEFKTPKKAMLKSLILPGWGDMYLGHRLLGAFEMVGSLIAWMIILSLVLAGQPGGLTAGLFLLVLVNGIDMLLTGHMARKGYLLEKKTEAMDIKTRLAQNHA